MGFPIRTNIFNAGSAAQRYFARFPVQVAILFSPTDAAFTEHLKSRFAELDRSTGEGLAFFAVLDPPEDWFRDRGNRGWWDNYQRDLGASAFTADNRILMREIGRLFGLAWHSFPCLVASPNLWRAEYLSCPTSAHHLDVQLNELAQLHDRLGQPNAGHIASTLEAVTGVPVRYHQPSEAVRQRLGEFYDTLQTFDTNRGLEEINFRHLLKRQLYAAENSLEALRRSSRSTRAPAGEESEGAEREATDSVIEDAAGRLVAPASVAAQVIHDLRKTPDLPDLLDEEAAVMVETAVTVGSFLENLAETSLRGLGPLGRLKPRGGYGRQREPSLLDLDFTPGAQGAWKAFELEVNLSVVQAARWARDVAMPTYFSLHDPNLPYDRGIVQTGRRGPRPVTVDINQFDWADRASGRHRFVALGDALCVIRSMLGAPGERLDSVIQLTLGSSLPAQLLEEWNVIVRIRNQGSHVHRLQRGEYEMVLRLSLAPANLGPLLRIKDSILRNGS
ncbi:MAG: hypothetical protein AB1641_10110 [Thermodesulfobacteriota bacterium]